MRRLTTPYDGGWTIQGFALTRSGVGTRGRPDTADLFTGFDQFGDRISPIDEVVEYAPHSAIPALRGIA